MSDVFVSEFYMRSICISLQKVMDFAEKNIK
jgi:hypothetical protein